LDVDTAVGDEVLGSEVGNFVGSELETVGCAVTGVFEGLGEE